MTQTMAGHGVASLCIFLRGRLIFRLISSIMFIIPAM